MAKILVVSESRAGELRKVAYEALASARAIASDAEVHAVLYGASGISAKAQSLADHGADKVLVLEHEGFAFYNPEALAATVASLVSGGSYDYVVFSATSHGRDLSPRVAAKLGVSLAADLTSIVVANGVVSGEHPINNGKVIATVALAGKPALLSVRPSAFAPVENAKALVVENLSSSVDPSASRVKVVELKQGSSDKIDLGDAPVIVAGGRGLKEPANFALCEALADAFGNAAVGATRAVTDEGWRPHADQIGQTGRNVSPDLYIAAGISGAIQHVAGMRNSRTIVAINKDKEAPIFKVADYGIVGDVLEVLPALTEAVKKVKQS